LFGKRMSFTYDNEEIVFFPGKNRIESNRIECGCCRIESNPNPDFLEGVESNRIRIESF
jgi:hypothetical protein